MSATSDRPAIAPPPPWWHGLIGLNGFGILLLVLACGWSLVRVFSISQELTDTSRKTLRVCHWQLESGYREALDAIIADYERMHPDIHIIQMPVTEKVYAQWLNVNMIADNAPDLVARGFANTATKGDSIAKYFRPLGRDMEKPNPYNAPQYLDEVESTDPELKQRLTTAPWRETIVDGMRGGYVAELQDYFSIPLSLFTMRMFYNKTLYREAFGHDVPPRTLGELFAAGEKIRAYGVTKGRVIDPIAGFGFQRELFQWTYQVPFMASYQRALDWDGSGEMPSIETWAGFQNGSLSYDKPQVKAYFLTIRELCRQFNPNFAAMDRAQAISSFAQGNAIFIASGAWDATSIFLAAKKFEVGVFPFPLPEPARVGDARVYPGNEAANSSGGGWGITKSSKHQEEALDFLRFISSHKWGQKFNRIAGWLPATIGAVTAPSMKEFMANPYGVSNVFNPRAGFELELIMKGKLDKFLGGETSYEDMAVGITEAMAHPRTGIDNIWRKTLEAENDRIRAGDRTLAVQNYRLLLGHGGSDVEARIREKVTEQVSQTNGAWLKLMYQQLNRKPLPELP